MKKLNFLVIGFFILVQQGASQPRAIGVTVAGGNGFGSAPNQLWSPAGVFVDPAGNIYIADQENNRVQRWAPNAAAGVTVAGGNGRGPAANQLNHPMDVFTDPAGNVYVADWGNFRVQQWRPGDAAGITVAGGNGPGPGANQLNAPYGIFVDLAGNIYVTDIRRIQKWAPGAAEGMTVAGGNVAGSAANQLSNPTSVFADPAGNIYIADAGNYRIQRWAPGASSGITVAGGNGRGSAESQLASPHGISVDTKGSIYITDYDNHRIQRWAPGASSGITVAAGLGYPTDVFVTATHFYVSGSLGASIIRFVVDSTTPATPVNLHVVSAGSSFIHLDWDDAPDNTGVIGYEVYRDGQKWYTTSVSDYLAGNLAANASYTFTIVALDSAGNQSSESTSLTASTTAGAAVMGITVAGGNGQGSAADQLYGPTNVFVDRTQHVYVTDWQNSRVQKWAAGAQAGITVAGGNGAGTGANQLYNPGGAYIDGEGNIYIADGGNFRIQKWSPGAAEGITVAGGNGAGPAANQMYPSDVFVDGSGNIYVADALNNRIQRWAPGASAGITVAGGRGPGSALDQLSEIAGIFVDDSANVYIDDEANHRIQKWVPGASAGITVAGGNGAGPTNNQLDHPWGVYVDTSGNVYVADMGNHRVQKWTPGATVGITVAGDNGTGSAGNQLNDPMDVALDAAGNIYVADRGNHRIQKFLAFGAQSLTYKYYEGDWNALPDFHAMPPVKTGVSSNIGISVRPPGVEEYFGIVWEGYINITTPGNYTFSTVSDDGSRLYFNTPYSADAAPLVDNDGLHGFDPAQGTVNIPAPGSYPISITYFNKTGGKGISVFWKGPGFDRQPIPDQAFIQPLSDTSSPATPLNLRAIAGGSSFINLDWDDATDNTGIAGYNVYVNGIKQYTTALSAISIVDLAAGTSYTFTVVAFDISGNRSIPSAPVTVTTIGSTGVLLYKVYKGDWNQLPDFSVLAPVTSGYSPNIDISVRPQGVDEYFGILWEGYINITTPGTYIFSTVSDDGSRLYFNTPYSAGGAPLVDNDGLHGFDPAQGTVDIPAPGIYPVSITYFNKMGGKGISVFWSGPGIVRQPIPDDAFVRPAPAVITATGLIGINATNINAVAPLPSGTTQVGKVYPAPFRDRFSISLYNGTSGNDIRVIVRDPAGRPVYTHHAGKLSIGNHTLTIPLGSIPLADGIYLVTVLANGRVVKTVTGFRSKR